MFGNVGSGAHLQRRSGHPGMAWIPHTATTSGGATCARMSFKRETCACSRPKRCACAQSGKCSYSLRTGSRACTQPASASSQLKAAGSKNSYRVRLVGLPAWPLSPRLLTTASQQPPRFYTSSMACRVSPRRNVGECSPLPTRPSTRNYTSRQSRV